MTRRARALFPALLLVAATRAPVAAQPAPGRVVVQVLDSAGAPLANAAVEVRSSDERASVARALTDAAGRARFMLAGGDSVQVAVRRLGHRPARLRLAVPDVATVRLARVPTRLARVTVRAGPSRCQPGFVPHDADSTIATLVEAVASYAAQEAALAQAHPWRATWRYDGRHHAASGAVLHADSARAFVVDARDDTLAYAPGRLVERRGLGYVKARWERVRDLASPVFLAHHCFRHATDADTALGRSATGIAFRADRTVRDADFDGVLLLDTETLEPLKLVLDWVHLPPGFRAMQEVVRFCRIAPGVSIPVERHFWQSYSTMLLRNDEPVAWSSGERRLEGLDWHATPPPAIVAPVDLAACPGARGATARR
mgnify:CR=1 FL=1